MAKSAADDLLAVLDAEGVPTGDAAPAERVHADGSWHAAVVVWVVRRDGQVLMRRVPEDDPCEPLRLAASAHAHLGPGAPAPAAAAAVERQLGVAARPGRLTHVGSFRSERRGRGGTVDREHQEAYVLQDDTPLEELALDPRSVDTVYEVPLDRAIALVEEGTYVPAPGFDSMQRVSNALLVAEDLPESGREALRAQLRALAAASPQAAASE